MYFVPNSSKCHDYTQGCHNYRALFLCDVALGRKYEVQHDKTALKSPPLGYNSVYGKHVGSLNYVTCQEGCLVIQMYTTLYCTVS